MPFIKLAQQYFEARRRCNFSARSFTFRLHHIHIVRSKVCCSSSLQEIEKHNRAAELQRLQQKKFEEDKRGLLQAIGAQTKRHAP